MRKKYTVYLVHHSHTDIGYTDRQEKIMRYHADFIRQAIQYLDRIHSSEDEEKKYGGFVWQCENFWQVKNFYCYANEEEKKSFEKYVRSGEIGLSGNYLNMTELVNEEAFSDVLDEMQQYGEKIGHPITSGMQADVNGFSWGYADQLCKHGIQSFFSALHNHHGMHPLYKKQQPFYLETPSGKKLLMWNGEHYHLGNEMFFAPEAGTNYFLQDEFSCRLVHNQVLNKKGENGKVYELSVLKTRLERYIDNLEKEGVEYNIIPFMVSGNITDNSSPSIAIAERVKLLNEEFNGQIVFQMTTLEHFFEVVKQRCKNIPVYRGDFTDWWADGIGSTPAAVKVYLDAARKYDMCKKAAGLMAPDWSVKMKSAAENLMLFAEHTWGYSSSIAEPWDTKVGELELKNLAYAANADTEVSMALDTVMEKKGATSVCHLMSQRYVVFNPHDVELQEPIHLFIEFWEYIDGLRYDSSMPLTVMDLKTGRKIPNQVREIARGTEVEIIVNLAPGESRILEIHLANREYSTITRLAVGGIDGQKDILLDPEKRADADVIDTTYFHIETDGEKGIREIVWRKDRSSLLRKHYMVTAFNGIYEKTEMDCGPCNTRRNMGRNRKSRATERSYGKVLNRRISGDGPVSITLRIDYKLEGTEIYSVFYRIYKEIPKIRITVIVHKTSKWEPENLFISLPFSAGDENILYFDKTGCIIRPGLDQLPGTCQDFYLLQNAVSWMGTDKSVSVILRDAPLVYLGKLEAKKIQLCNGKDIEHNREELFSWPMNNFWETNFKADLGGFYEFRYDLVVREQERPEKLFSALKAQNEGILVEYAKM